MVEGFSVPIKCMWMDFLHELRVLGGGRSCSCNKQRWRDYLKGCQEGWTNFLLKSAEKGGMISCICHAVHSDLILYTVSSDIGFYQWFAWRKGRESIQSISMSGDISCLCAVKVELLSVTARCHCEP